MKRSLMFIAIIAFAAFALSGCQFVIGIIFETDLSINNIELIWDSSEQFSGVQITIDNDGARADDVNYNLVLSPDQNADNGDTSIYNGSFDIDFKKSTGIWVPVDSMNLGSVDDPPGWYHFGVILDVDDSDSSDNAATSVDSIYWEGGGGATLPEDIYEYDNDQASAYPTSVPAYQDHTFHVGGDEDWVRVDLIGGYEFVAETYSTGGMDCDTVIELWDNYGTMLWDVDDYATNSTEYLSYYPSSSDTYYVRVYEYWDYVGDYALDLRQNF